MSRRYRNVSFTRLITKILILFIGYIALNRYVQTVVVSESIHDNFSLTPLFWAIFTLIVEIFVVLIIYQFYQMYLLKKAGIYEIDAMKGGDLFEEKLCILFSQLGYSVEHYSKHHRGNEYGVDIIIEKDGIRTAVQAKRFKRREHVDNTAVEKLDAGKKITNCDNALIVTNSTFTKNARFAANKLNVELWDRKELVTQLLKAKNN
ncbi:MAG: restriction endonuclease [Microgenomates group bacterium]